MNLSVMEEKFYSLLEQLISSLSTQDVGHIKEMVYVGEIGIAFEDFCTQLYERGAKCSEEQLQELQLLGEALHVNPWYWEMLVAS